MNVGLIGSGSRTMKVTCSRTMTPGRRTAQLKIQSLNVCKGLKEALYFGARIRAFSGCDLGVQT